MFTTMASGLGSGRGGVVIQFSGSQYSLIPDIPVTDFVIVCCFVMLLSYQVYFHCQECRLPLTLVGLLSLHCGFVSL
jgi:hypothetical protein